jgi:hypothetical protein
MFKFNWIAKSRTVIDIAKRCDYLVARFKREKAFLEEAKKGIKKKRKESAEEEIKISKKKRKISSSSEEEEEDIIEIRSDEEVEDKKNKTNKKIESIKSQPSIRKRSEKAQTKIAVS